jgi:hypothetical protein
MEEFTNKILNGIKITQFNEFPVSRPHLHPFPWPLPKQPPRMEDNQVEAIQNGKMNKMPLLLKDLLKEEKEEEEQRQSQHPNQK